MWLMVNLFGIMKGKWSAVVRLPIVLILLLGIGYNVYSQTPINSLSELKGRLDDSNGNFKMTPGTYHFNKENTGPGKLFGNETILMFKGSNNIFDFTGVKFEFDTEALDDFTDWVVEFWPVGDNNVYLNLTMEDIGMNVVGRGGEAIHLDGSDNRIEGFHITVRGSFPYGYGDIFGKGGGSVIGHQKHAGILVRGDRNHLLNDTVIMRSYGHGIFMQGSEYARVEGCYVEGETRTINEVLQEKGTGSPADNVDFLTVWGYHLYELEHNYTFSLQEAGIRAYSQGTNYGTSTSRQTKNTHVIDCKIVKMRVGVNTGAEGGNDKLIKDCTALACESGFWLGHDGTVVGCKGDASLGPLMSEDVGRSNATYEVTLLDNYIPKLGNCPYIFIAGNNHNVTLHDGTTSYNPDIEIQVGGTRQAHRWLQGSASNPLTRSASGLTFTNNTKYPVVVESNASNNKVFSCGPVMKNSGSNNTITQLTDCNYTRACNNTAENLQAECYDNMFGIETQTLNENIELAVSNIHAGDWIKFNGIDLSTMVSVKAIAGTTVEGAAIEVRLDSVDGIVIATIPVSNTSSFDTYQEFTESLDQVINATVDVCFVFTGSDGLLFNLDKISFIQDPCSNATYAAYLPISAESFCTSSGVVIEDLDVASQVVSDISEGDYLRFSNVYFGDGDVYNAIRVLASAGTKGGNIEVRSDSVDGELLSNVVVAGTGSFDDYKIFTGFAAGNFTGTHDLYLVFKGTGDQLMKVDNFYFLHDQCAGKSFVARDRMEAEDYCEMSGVDTYDNSYLGNIQNGDWIRFGSVDFTSKSPSSVTISLSGKSSDGYVDVLLGSPSRGTIIASKNITSTGGWTSWKEFLIGLNQEATGIHDVYIYFRESGNNINWVQFSDYELSGDAIITSDEYVVSQEDKTIVNVPEGTSVSKFERNLTASTGASFDTYKSNGRTVATKLETGCKVIVTSEDGKNTIGYKVELLVGNHIVFDNEKIEIYPNPVADNLTIEGNIHSKVEIVNSLGNKLFEEILLFEKQTISMKNLEKGIYFVRVVNEKSTRAYKLIKQ